MGDVQLCDEPVEVEAHGQLVALNGKQEGDDLHGTQADDHDAHEEEMGGHVDLEHAQEGRQFDTQEHVAP